MIPEMNIDYGYIGYSGMILIVHGYWKQKMELLIVHLRCHCLNNISQQSQWFFATTLCTTSQMQLHKCIILQYMLLLHWHALMPLLISSFFIIELKMFSKMLKNYIANYLQFLLVLAPCKQYLLYHKSVIHNSNSTEQGWQLIFQVSTILRVKKCALPNNKSVNNDSDHCDSDGI